MRMCCKCKDNPAREQHKSSICRPCHNAQEKLINARKRKFTHKYKMLCGCSICGYKENPYALQFDHIDPSTKTANNPAIYGWKRMKREIRKCRVLCANCHMIATYDPRAK